VELIVISRILRKFGYGCVTSVTLCHVDCRKYFSPYLQDGRTVRCYIVALWRLKHVGHFTETKGHLHTCKASNVHKQNIMHVNRSLLTQAVFKV